MRVVTQPSTDYITNTDKHNIQHTQHNHNQINLRVDAIKTSFSTILEGIRHWQPRVTRQGGGGSQQDPLIPVVDNLNSCSTTSQHTDTDASHWLKKTRYGTKG